MTQRLGAPPESWTFFGQCFDAGDQTKLKCAILLTTSRYFFTICRADGEPGARYISYEAIPFFKYRNPALYRRLMVGVAFLEMRNDAVDSEERWHKERGKSHRS